ncbi:hypothetical protein PR003_g20810 [Phytophthora rubi]|uniref:Uncharacterized protein n=1 Tax=Phytophthora rubi TaxID=129364 RepID=A0A6A3LFN7_9STRA|nr:hypothetical protein PR001_g18602 [Phytophthora rubi]KAE9018242.1 hypothetical protein PR002_g13162 [Phytophthora rubi]KAE9308164.1 hypothetical protein PR003_g20810 [Phytophthora rubi]
MPYDAVNHRIHCYISYRGLKWEPDVVNRVVPETYSSQYCGLKMEKSSAMRSHRRYCSKNADAAKNQETRRRSGNKEGEYICSLWVLQRVVQGSRVPRMQQEA